MHTFLTPEPITLEIRNAAGEIQIVLSDTQTTTVVVTASTSHPLGFLDDVFKAFGGGRRFEGFGRGRPFGNRSSAPFGEQPSEDAPGSVQTDMPDLADLVRVEHRSGEKPTVIVDTDPARDGWRSAFSITVTAPTGSNVRLQAQSSDVTVTGSAQLVDIRTASGDIQLDEARGRTLLQTASGDVSVAKAGAEVDVRTASGDVEVGPVAGDALVHTTSGDIRLGAVAGNISARSVSGDVRVSDAVSGQAEVNAVSGDVQIGVHAGTLASINLSTVSGTTDTDFEVTGEVPEGDAPVLEITVKTTSGDIRLCRAA
jgi:Putative adhesin